LLNSQEQQDQGSEEEKYSPEKGRGLVDTQKDMCQELNQDAANPVLSRRLWKPPTTRKDLKCSQILILHHNIGINCFITIRPKIC
jgi:hypothetical protein